MTDTLTSILQWLVPSGGLGAVIAWIASRRIRNTRVAKEVHDTYKAMYEDVQNTLLAISKDNEKLYKAINKLERAVSRATMCRHWFDCPIRAELPDAKAIVCGKHTKHASGQPHIRTPSIEDDTCPGGESESCNTGTEAS